LILIFSSINRCGEQEESKRGWVQTVSAKAKKLKPINGEPRRNSSKKENRDKIVAGAENRTSNTAGLDRGGRRMAVRGQFPLL